MLLGEKARREEFTRRQSERQENLRLAAEATAENKRRYEQGRTDTIAAREDQQAARVSELSLMQENALGLIAERDRLSRIPTEQMTASQNRQKLKLDAEIKNIESQITKRTKETELLGIPKKVSPKETTDIEIAKRKQALAEQGARLKEAGYSTKQFDFISNTKNDFALRQQQADIENNRIGNKVVYVKSQDPVDILGPFDLGAFTKKGLFDAVPIPDGMIIAGKPPTGIEIINRAKAANMTVQEFIAEVQRRSQ